MSNLGATDVDSRLEEQLIDGILYAFQEQTNEVCMFVCTYGVYSLCVVYSCVRRLIIYMDIHSVLVTQ